MTDLVVGWILGFIVGALTMSLFMSGDSTEQPWRPKEEQMAHTPGPLFIKAAAKGTERDYAIYTSKNHVIAEAFEHVAKDTRIDAHSNARLIAAAPDLLEALEAITKLLAEHVEVRENQPIDSFLACDPCRDAVDVARTAIQKAKEED